MCANAQGRAESRKQTGSGISRDKDLSRESKIEPVLFLQDQCVSQIAEARCWTRMRLVDILRSLTVATPEEPYQQKLSHVCFARLENEHVRLRLIMAGRRGTVAASHDDRVHCGSGLCGPDCRRIGHHAGALGSTFRSDRYSRWTDYRTRPPGRGLTTG